MSQNPPEGAGGPENELVRANRKGRAQGGQLRRLISFEKWSKTDPRSTTVANKVKLPENTSKNPMAPPSPPRRGRRKTKTTSSLRQPTSAQKEKESHPPTDKPTQPKPTKGQTTRKTSSAHQANPTQSEGVPRPVRRPIGKKVPSGAETPPVPVTTVVENKEKEGDGDRDDLVDDEDPITSDPVDKEGRADDDPIEDAPMEDFAAASPILDVDEHSPDEDEERARLALRRTPRGTPPNEVEPPSDKGPDKGKGKKRQIEESDDDGDESTTENSDKDDPPAHKKAKVPPPTKPKPNEAEGPSKKGKGKKRHLEESGGDDDDGSTTEDNRPARKKTTINKGIAVANVLDSYREHNPGTLTPKLKTTKQKRLEKNRRRITTNTRTKTSHRRRSPSLSDSDIGTEGEEDIKPRSRAQRHSQHSYKSRAPMPTQEGYYPPLWRPIIRDSKSRLRLRLTTDNMFPDEPTASKWCQDALADVIHERDSKPSADKLVEDGHYDPTNMAKAIFQDIWSFRSAARAPAREAAKLYALHENAKHDLDVPPTTAELARALMESGDYLHIVNEDGDVAHNFQHPAVKSFCIEFFYKKKKSLASIFPDTFGEKFPPFGIAFAGTVLFHALDLVAQNTTGMKAVEFTSARYQEIYEQIMGLINRDRKGSRAVKKDLKKYLIAIAEEGSTYSGKSKKSSNTPAVQFRSRT